MHCVLPLCCTPAYQLYHHCSHCDMVPVFRFGHERWANYAASSASYSLAFVLMPNSNVKLRYSSHACCYVHCISYVHSLDCLLLGDYCAHDVYQHQWTIMHNCNQKCQPRQVSTAQMKEKLSFLRILDFYM